MLSGLKRHPFSASLLPRPTGWPAVNVYFYYSTSSPRGRVVKPLASHSSQCEFEPSQKLRHMLSGLKVHAFSASLLRWKKIEFSADGVARSKCFFVAFNIEKPNSLIFLLKDSLSGSGPDRQTRRETGVGKAEAFQIGPQRPSQAALALSWPSG